MPRRRPSPPGGRLRVGLLAKPINNNYWCSPQSILVYEGAGWGYARSYYKFRVLDHNPRYRRRITIERASFEWVVPVAANGPARNGQVQNA